MFRYIKRRIGKSSSYYVVFELTIITILTKLIGFVREMIMADIYGTSVIVDTYVMATTIPGIVFGGFSALTVGFIPIYKQIKNECSLDYAEEFTSKCLNYEIILNLVCIIITELFTEQIVSITAPGYTGTTKELLVVFLRFSILHILLTNTASVFGSYLHCKNVYVPVAVSNLLLSSIQIIAIFLSKGKSSLILIHGHNLSFFLQVLLLITISIKNGYRYQFAYQHDIYTASLFRMMIPVFLSDMAGQINSFLDKMFSSQLGEGMLSGLTYSHLIITLINSILTTGIMTVFFTNISDLVVLGEKDKINTKMRELTILMLALYIPITIGLEMMPQEITALIYERGSFLGDSVFYTAGPLAMYALSLPFSVVTGLLYRVLYASKDTLTGLFASICSFILNFVLNMMFIKPLGNSGLALASSVASIICMPIVIIRFRKLGYRYFDRNLVFSCVKICICSIPMMVVVYIFKKCIIMSKVVTVISIIVGAVVYYLGIRFARISELDQFFSIIVKYKSKFVGIFRRRV